MEQSKKLLLLAAVAASLLLTFSADPAADSPEAEDAGSSSSASSTGPSWWGEWQILTKSNFSSEIRRHNQILLMVTAPWNGESRALRKEVGSLIANKTFDLGSLSLMVLNKFSDKMLAEALGATDEMTLFYYHYSKPYRYRGRLRAINILSSISHFLSLKYEGFPLKNLQNQEELKSFLLSTDRAIILLEFCGWSAKLMLRENNGSWETPFTSQNHSENVDAFGQNLVRKTDKVFQKYNKATEYELTSRVEEAVADSPWVGTYAFGNHSSNVPEDRSADARMSCTPEDFQQFESYFQKLTATARDYSLPPDRLRFGLVSERSLLPLIGINNPDKWLVTLHFYGCPNCTLIVREQDDLRKIIQTQNSVVTEIDADGDTPYFPANKPSVILFIDRLSDSPRVREDSQLSLEVLRKFAWHNQLTEQGGKQKIINPGRYVEDVSPKTWNRKVSGSFSRQIRNSHQISKILKIKDNKAVLIVNEGQSISSRNPHLENQDSIYDTLLHLLQQKNPSEKTKEKKISLVAKEIGFELLSDDFRVQVVDSSINDENHLRNIIDSAAVIPENHLRNIIDSAAVIPEDHTFELTDGRTGSSDSVDEGELQDDAQFTASSKLNEPLEAIPDLAEHQKATLINDTNKDTSSEIKLKADGGFSDITDFNHETEKLEPQETELPKYHEENVYNLGEESPVTGGHSLTDTFDNVVREPNTREVAREIGHSSYSQLVRDETTHKMISLTFGEPVEQLFQHQPFVGSFYFTDGGYQLLRSLTSSSRIPSLVILDSFQKQHYVFSKGTELTYSSLVSFMDRFLNGSLSPYRRSASRHGIHKEMPKPPFVNLDFHEADSIPQLNVDTFCERVVGYKSCEIDNILPASTMERVGYAWKKDVLVLFSTSWCGFCQRMELIVREVYRAFSSFSNLSKSQSNSNDPLQTKDKKKDLMSNELPSIFLMDCTNNDCGLFFKALRKKEQYPMLVLFPAENKTATIYEGDVSVIGIMEFLQSYGTNSDYLFKQKGQLWTPTIKGSKRVSPVSTLSIREKADTSEENHSKYLLEVPGASKGKHLMEAYKTIDLLNNGIRVVVGSVLAASDKLQDAVPFDNSTVVIVAAEENEGFVGLIINKRINWDNFEQLDGYLEHLKQAPLFYGGPVRYGTLSLVSLSRRPTKGYARVAEGIHFGNLTTTRLIIEKIKLGEESIDDFWFFLGFSSWGYGQLFDELRQGAWELSRHPIEYLDWPES